MGENSAISWCDHTQNFWIGCTAISSACDHCYARTLMQDRYGRVVWGAGQPRVRTKTWGAPIKWNREAAITGERPRVFCSSLSDVFDNEVPSEWRAEMWQIIRATPNLRWILLTKRIGNARKMLPVDWNSGAYRHVGLMATLENQEVWDRDIDKLLSTPAAWHGVSIEPMLGPVTMRWRNDLRPPDWIITGGESGPVRRELDMAWVRDMRDQCEFAGIAFHHKQNGGVRGKDNGCLVDGVEHKHFPAALAA